MSIHTNLLGEIMKDKKKTDLRVFFDHTVDLLSTLIVDDKVQMMLKEYMVLIDDQSLVSEGLLNEEVIDFLHRHLKNMFTNQKVLVLNIDYLDNLYKLELEGKEKNIVNDLSNFTWHLDLELHASKENCVYGFARYDGDRKK